MRIRYTLVFTLNDQEIGHEHCFWGMPMREALKLPAKMFVANMPIKNRDGPIPSYN